jgi:hypothetical protein
MAIHREAKRVRAARFTGPGLALYAYSDDAVSWRARLEDLLVLMQRDPDLIELAMVRPGPVYASNWQSMEVNGPPMNVRSAWYRRYRDHLRDTVPDAHGAQVLTSAHLDRAHDLSNWNVEEIAADRYLVTARDLDPWFSTGLADPATVAAARADFGDMLRWPERRPPTGSP